MCRNIRFVAKEVLRLIHLGEGNLLKIDDPTTDLKVTILHF